MIIRLAAFADEAGASLEEQITALKENEISLLEIRSVGGKNASNFTVREAEECHEKLAAQGIAVWSVGSPLGKACLNSDEKKYNEKAEHVCQIAEILGAENIRGFSFYTLFKDSAQSKVIKRVKALVDIAASHSLNYCHENEKHIFGDTLERVKLLSQAIPEMKLIYDPANFLQCKQSPEKTLSELLDKAYYFHAKDVAGNSKVVPCGFGDGRLDYIVNSIKKDSVFTIEPHLIFFKGCEGFNASEYDLASKRGRFDCAVKCFKNLLLANGFADKGGYFEK